MTRELDAAGHVEKARSFLEEASAADQNGLPRAIIHVCYYAMYHAVAAALMGAHGSAPTNHGRAIHKGSTLLAERLGPEGEQAGESIYRAYQLRLLVDYSIDPDHLVDRAVSLREEAEQVLACCTKLLDGA
jgi:uncharacterized protein (UPF0332 family)